MLDLKSALEDVDRELKDAHEQQQRLTGTIESLEAEARGLELAIARHNGQVQEMVAANGETAAWRKMPRTDAVIRVLAEADEPLGPAGITGELHQHGREDRRDPVAATLAYLKKKGRVSHESYGMWTVDTLSEDNLDRLQGGG